MYYTFLPLHLSTSYPASFKFEVTIGARLSAHPSHYRADSGLHPLETCAAMRTHKKSSELIRAFYLLFMPLYISACYRRSLWVYLCHRTNPLSLKRISTSVPFATLSAIFRAIFSLNDRGSSDSFFLSIA